MTKRMCQGLVTALALIAMMASTSWTSNPLVGVAQAQAPAAARRAAAIPRSADGHPDLQGTYSNDDETGRSLNRRVEVAIFASEEYREEVEARYGND